ncbi:MAG: transposase [Chloroflexi bacterium]|nr:transposase [Chloroflexota bacterium]
MSTPTPLSNYPYFVTCTVVEWLAIFSTAAYRQIVLDSLDFIQKNKHVRLNAFVVMPTHLHAIILPEDRVNLSDVLRDFKRHTSRTISKTASSRQDQTALARFSMARQENRAQQESDYQVWQEGSYPEAIFSVRFARQKLEYIHKNPVRGGLVENELNYPFSSARAYHLNEQTYPPVTLLELS